MDETDEEWNRRHRQETALQRIDRNFTELLQELRVAQTGVQILFAFLLTLAFTQRFGTVTAFQRGIYFVTLLLTAVAASLLIAPVAMHRLLFRRHQKQRLVIVSSRLAITGLLILGLAIVGVLLLISDVLYGHRVGMVTALLSACWFGFLWYALPLAWVARLPRQGEALEGLPGDGPNKPSSDAPPQRQTTSPP